MGPSKKLNFRLHNPQVLPTLQRKLLQSQQGLFYGEATHFPDGFPLGMLPILPIASSCGLDRVWIRDVITALACSPSLLLKSQSSIAFPSSALTLDIRLKLLLKTFSCEGSPSTSPPPCVPATLLISPWLELAILSCQDLLECRFHHSAFQLFTKNYINLLSVTNNVSLFFKPASI